MRKVYSEESPPQTDMVYGRWRGMGRGRGHQRPSPLPLPPLSGEGEATIIYGQGEEQEWY